MNIDWSTGRFTYAKEQPVCRVTVAADWAPRANHEEQMLAEPEGVYGDLLPLLRQSDLNIINVETVLGNVGSPVPKGGPNLRGDERAVKSLSAAPFHVACLANSHTMDFGPASLQHTMEVLQGEGLQTVGAGMSSAQAATPIIARAGKLQIGIINCGEGEQSQSVGGGPGAYWFDPVEIATKVAEMKKRTDAVLVIFHGGREHTPVPPPYVVKMLREMAESGPDAIIAHHPHVPQGIDTSGPCPIFYSLGNFLFWMRNSSNRFYLRVGYLVHLDLGESGLSQFAITPYLINPTGVTSMQGNLKDSFLLDLQEASKAVSDLTAVELCWDAYADFMGVEFCQKQLKEGLEVVESDTLTGAAVLRNLFSSPAHRDFYTRVMTRVTNRQVGTASEWAQALVRRWLTTSFEETTRSS